MNSDPFVDEFRCEFEFDRVGENVPSADLKLARVKVGKLSVGGIPLAFEVYWHFGKDSFVGFLSRLVEYVCLVDSDKGVDGTCSW